MAQSRSRSRNASRSASELRPQLSKSAPSDHSRKSMNRIFSGQHIDDVSIYHADDELRGSRNSVVLEKRGASKSTSSSGSGSPSSEKDPEKGIEEDQSAQDPPRDPNLVTWDGPDDPQNPKNWTTKQKWLATLVVSSFTFISPVSSTMVAPSLGVMARDFSITNQVEAQIILSIFVLAYAVGPLFLGPMSEIYGRVPVLQLANLFFLVFNFACGFAKTKVQIIIFRFLAGLGGSAPQSIGGGVLGDCWRADERGRSIAVYSLAPLLGPALGPVGAGFITEYSTWPWDFHSTSILCVVIQISGLLFLRETYPPKLLYLKAKKLRKETGNQSLRSEFEDPERSWQKIMKRSLIRPFKMLATQPIVQVLALYMAYVYGLTYLVHSTFPVLWTQHYGESPGIGGLNYLSIGLGYFLGVQITAPLNDKFYKRLRRRNGGVGEAEFRIPLMNVGSLFIPVGFFIYAWTAQYRVHWIGPNIAAVIFSIGMIIIFQCTQTYIVDAYTQYAASALAASTVLRSIAAFGFPLFAPYMYDALDYGWGNSLLAFIAIGIGIPSPILLWIYGKRLREKSPYAAGGG